MSPLQCCSDSTEHCSVQGDEANATGLVTLAICAHVLTWPISNSRPSVHLSNSHAFALGLVKKHYCKEATCSYMTRTMPRLTEVVARFVWHLLMCCACRCIYIYIYIYMCVKNNSIFVDFCMHAGQIDVSAWLPDLVWRSLCPPRGNSRPLTPRSAGRCMPF